VQLIPIGDESSLGFVGFPGARAGQSEVNPSKSVQSRSDMVSSLVSSGLAWSVGAFSLVLRFCLFAL